MSEDKNGNLITPIDDFKRETLLGRLVKSFDWGGISLFGIGRIVAKVFSTSPKARGPRVDITDKGLFIYDTYGALIFFLSNDVNAVNPVTPTVVIGSGLFINLIRSIASALVLSSQTGKAKLTLTDATNGKLQFLGDNASGNLQFTIDTTNGLTFNVGTQTLAFDDNGFFVSNSAGVSNPIGESGVYTPTLTNVTNVDASTAYQCQWSRSGDTVIVSGTVQIDPTALAFTNLRMSLPIASNLGIASDLGGTAVCSSVVQASGIRASAALDEAAFLFVATDTTAQDFHFVFMYRII